MVTFSADVGNTEGNKIIKNSFDNEIPRNGTEWYEYLKEKYDKDNVEWYTENGTTIFYRKMSVGEYEKTKITKLQPSIKGTEPVKWLSESTEKVNVFKNKNVLDENVLENGEVIVGFKIDPEYYKKIKNTAIPQQGCKGKKDCVLYHFEGLKKNGMERNFGVPNECIEEFNENVNEVIFVGNVSR